MSQSNSAYEKDTVSSLISFCQEGCPGHQVKLSCMDHETKPSHIQGNILFCQSECQGHTFDPLIQCQ